MAFNRENYRVIYKIEHKNSFLYETIEVNLLSEGKNKLNELQEILKVHKPNIEFPPNSIHYQMAADEPGKLSKFYINNEVDFEEFRRMCDFRNYILHVPMHVPEIKPYHTTPYVSKNNLTKLVQTENPTKVDVGQTSVENFKPRLEKVAKDLCNAAAVVNEFDKYVESKQTIMKKSWLQRHLESKQAQKVVSIEENTGKSRNDSTSEEWDIVEAIESSEKSTPKKSDESSSSFTSDNLLPSTQATLGDISTKDSQTDEYWDIVESSETSKEKIPKESVRNWKSLGSAVDADLLTEKLEKVQSGEVITKVVSPQCEGVFPPRWEKAFSPQCEEVIMKVYSPHREEEVITVNRNILKTVNMDEYIDKVVEKSVQSVQSAANPDMGPSSFAELSQQLLNHVNSKTPTTQALAPQVEEPIPNNAEQNANMSKVNEKSIGSGDVELKTDGLVEMNPGKASKDEVHLDGRKSPDLPKEVVGETTPPAPLHSDPRVNEALVTLVEMGIKVEDKIVEILEMVNGDISAALELFLNIDP